jgi:hypothetical protein
MPEYTSFAGLLRLAAGEALSTDGWAFTGRNIDIIDRLLRAGAQTHRHDAHAALANPTAAGPGVALANTGGQIPADLPIAVGFTWIDADGGETTLSPVTTVTTDPGLTAPTDAPTAVLDHTAGTLLAQTYYYAVTVVDGSGGETPLGPSAIITVPSGFAANEITLSDLDTIVTAVGGTGWRMWRSVAGGPFSLIAVGTSATFTDDGINCVDCAVQPPDPDLGLGSTNATNRIIVTVPATHPTQAVKFRIYASLDGSFVAPALLGEFDDTDFGSALEFTSLTFLDDSPPPVSNTLQGADKIDPDTEILDFNWKRPVDTVGDLPPTGNVAGDVRLVKSIPPAFYSWDGTAWVAFAAGHIIQDATPTAMPTRTNLRFEGAGVQVNDIGTDDATVVLIQGKEIQDEGTPLPNQSAIDFQGAGVTATDDATNGVTVVTIPGGGGGGSAHVIEDEGTALPARSNLDFVGAGVDATDDSVNDKTVITIPHDGHDIYDEGVGGSLLTGRSGLSFEGAGVTVTDNATDDLTVVTIPGGSGGTNDVAIFVVNSNPSNASGGNTSADWNESRDDGGHWTLGNSVMGGTDTELVCGAAGVYIVEFVYDSPAGAYLASAAIRHYNSASALQREYIDVMDANTPVGNPASVTSQHTLVLASGDKLVPLFSQNSGSAKTTAGGKVVVVKVA